ncbi:pilus (IV) biogenesis [Methylibium petroleiphilum]|uniref:Pilus (IV) biogenesis n=1 Tax=Methylibium petroleiphilum (strain ATCC BAA-1232 / LMG 22953 / PM1) TaxID=420662 RepID=A2SNP4_METPP|nr:pilus (IV) biogenesis [Methylibium petroleiphilum]ABM97183.1 Pilus (IV) biogenesis [Methylibium petroleiphilum PM1]
MRTKPRRAAFLLAPLTLALLSGCASILPGRSTDFPADKPVAGPNIPSSVAAQDLVELPVQSATLDMQPAEPDDALPNTQVPPISVTGVGYIEALRLLLEGSSYSLAVAGDVRAFEGVSAGSLRTPAGPLRDVVEQLSRGGGFFLSVRGNKVTASATKRFVIEVPNLMDQPAAANLLASLRRLGARDAYLDAIGNTITFEASRSSWQAIDGYLAHMRRSKPMLVYEVEVYQVELTDTTNNGIGFTSLAKNLAGDPNNWSVARGGTGIGSASFAFVGKNVTMAAVVDLLQTQGTVSSLSRPRVAMLSGSSSKFRVGQTTKYVAKISQQNTGSGSASTTTTSSADTDELKTGFELQMKGGYQEGSVFTNLKLTISELIRFNDFEAFGTKLRLPDTTEREIETLVRARPGDLILLGGLGSTKQNAGHEAGITGVNKSTTASRSEIVVAMRPRVISFTAAKEAQQ